MGKIFSKHISDKKKLVLKNINNSQNAIVKKPNNTIKYGGKCFEQTLPQRKYMCNKLAYGKILNIMSYQRNAN